MTLRLLCNENVPRALVDALREQGHDAAWVADLMPGVSDATVLRQAAAEARICLTFDKDFGELPRVRQGSRPRGSFCCGCRSIRRAPPLNGSPR